MIAFLDRWDWLRIPGVIVVAAWALYLYGTPSSKVGTDLKKLREWWHSREKR